MRKDYEKFKETDEKLLIVAMFILIITSFREKVSKAVDVNAVVLSLNRVWSSNYYLTETNREQYCQITIPSDGKLNLRVMSYFGNSVYNSLNWELYSNDLSKKLAEGNGYGSEKSPETDKTNPKDMFPRL